MTITRMLAALAASTVLSQAALAQSASTDDMATGAGGADATSPTDGAPMTATLSFTAADGQAVGGGMMTDTGQSITLTAQFSNLPEGEHGFHVHETGRCDTPDFKSAGSHFAPYGNEHGFESDGGPHAGDMPNLTVNDGGVAIARVELERIKLIGEGEGVLLDDDGAAVIVHAQPDDYQDIDSAGARIACAVVEAN
jgi:Cu-Zn family superoxide dismutase